MRPYNNTRCFGFQLYFKVTIMHFICIAFFDKSQHCWLLPKLFWHPMVDRLSTLIHLPAIAPDIFSVIVCNREYDTNEDSSRRSLIGEEEPVVPITSCHNLLEAAMAKPQLPFFPLIWLINLNCDHQHFNCSSSAQDICPIL